MIKFRLPAAVLLLSCATFSCGDKGTREPGTAETPPPSNGPSCLAKGCCYTGLPDTTASQCGCEPYAGALEGRLAMLQISKQVQAKIAQCVNGSLDATIYKWDIAKIKADGCVKKEVELEPKVRDELLKVLDEYKVSGESTKDVWKDCYARTTGGTPAPSASAAASAPPPSAPLSSSANP